VKRNHGSNVQAIGTQRAGSICGPQADTWTGSLAPGESKPRQSRDKRARAGNTRHLKPPETTAQWREVGRKNSAGERRRACPAKRRTRNQVRRTPHRVSPARPVESSRSAAGTSALQVVQTRLVGDCGTHSQRARHAFCVPVLPQVASRAGSGTRIQENAAGAVGPLAPSRGVTKRDGTLTEKRAVCRRSPARKSGRSQHAQ